MKHPNEVEEKRQWSNTKTVELLSADLAPHIFKYLTLSELARFRVNKYLEALITPFFIQNINRQLVFKDFACGYDHMVALNEMNQVFIAGYDILPENKNDRQDLHRVSLKPHPEDNSPIKAIAAGGRSSFIVSQNNFLYAKGSNYNGECGVGNKRRMLHNLPLHITLIKIWRALTLTQQ